VLIWFLSFGSCFLFSRFRCQVQEVTRNFRPRHFSGIFKRFVLILNHYVSGKKILLAVTGSIAAYKSILLVRLLVKAGADVKVVMTPAAKDFVSPLTLSTLSKNPVVSDLFNNESWSNHVEMGRWADVMVVAPLSCNTLAKMANGLCDNMLLATYLSATCPVVVAPAMDEDMWHHPIPGRTCKSWNHSAIRSFPSRKANWPAVFMAMAEWQSRRPLCVSWKRIFF